MSCQTPSRGGLNYKMARPTVENKEKAKMSLLNRSEQKKGLMAGMTEAKSHRLEAFRSFGK